VAAPQRRAPLRGTYVVESCAGKPRVGDEMA
jgi:hypothetical protein